MAFRAIRNNMLRSVLTMLIIAFGIMALVGILTSIEVIRGALTNSLGSMGATSFQITSEKLVRKRSGRGSNISVTQSKDITYDQARAFAARYELPATVGISMSATGMATASYHGEKTNPNVQVLGVDNHYFSISNTGMQAGRLFSAAELATTAQVCILGEGVAKKLFRSGVAAGLGENISIDGRQYRVIGMAESKGGSMMMNADNSIYLPLQAARAAYGGNNSYVLSVQVADVSRKPVAAEEAEGLMRAVRRVPLGAESDFAINQDDTLVNMLLEDIRYVRWAAVIIGIITLLGSVIGLMNIMLVSVAERTREIGVSKALGAPSGVIKAQFLTESVLISVLGGALGVILGILAGNILSLSFDIGFVVPWLWIIGGLLLCAAVGIASGIYPAVRASRLDPIEALRYE